MVPLGFEPDPVVYLTERSASLREHARELAFPGGRPEAGDLDLWATAAREAREEVGIESARCLGELSTMPIFTSDYRLVPYVAAVCGAELRPTSSEVERVLAMRLMSVFDSTVIHAIPWEYAGSQLLSPVFEIRDRVLYGATAHVLHELLRLLEPCFASPLPPLEAGKYSWEEVRVW